MRGHAKLVDRVVLNSNAIALSDEPNPPPYDPLLQIPGSVNIVNQGLDIALSIRFFVQGTDFFFHEFHRFYAKLAPHIWAVEVARHSDYSGPSIAGHTCNCAEGPDGGLLFKDDQIQFVKRSVQEIRESFKEYSDTPLTYGILTFDEAGTLLRVDGPIAQDSVATQWKYGNATMRFLYGVDTAGEITEESWVRPTEAPLEKPQIYYDTPFCGQYVLEEDNFDGMNIWDPFPTKQFFPWNEPIQMDTQLADNVLLHNQSSALSDEINPPPYDPLLQIPGSVNIVSGGLNAALDVEFPVYTSNTSEESHVRSLHRIYAKLAPHVWAIEICSDCSDRVKSHYIVRTSDCDTSTIQDLRATYADSPRLPLSYGILTFDDQGELLHVDGPIGQGTFEVQWVDGTIANITFLYGINGTGEVTQESWLRPRETNVYKDLFSRGADPSTIICSTELLSNRNSYIDELEPCTPIIQMYEKCIFNGGWDHLWDPLWHYFLPLSPHCEVCSHPWDLAVANTTFYENT